MKITELCLQFQEEFEKIKTLQESIRHISEETFNQVLQDFAFAFNNKELLYSLLVSLKNIINSRPKQYDIYIRLLCEVLKSVKNFHFNINSLAFLFPNFNIICSLLAAGIISKKKILKLHKVLKFGTFDYDSILENSDFSIFNEKEIYQIMKESFPPRTVKKPDFRLITIIINDDLDSFQDLVSKEDLNIDSQIYLGKLDTIFKKECFLIEYAAFYGSIKIVKYLILQGAKLPKKLMEYAVLGNNNEIIHIVEQKIQEKIDQTVLLEAIRYHQNELAHYLIENYDIHLNIDSLISSIKSFNIEFFEKSLNCITENDINNIGINKKTCIYLACKTGQLYILRFLEKIDGIDINKSVKKGRWAEDIPLAIAVNRSFVEIVDHMIQNSSISINKIVEDHSIVSLAVAKGNTKIVKLLLTHPKIDVNQFIEDDAPLLIASQQANLEIFKSIVEAKGVDLRIQDDNGLSAIHYTVMYGNIPKIDYLLKYHGDIVKLESKDCHGVSFFINLTPIHYAAIHDKIESFEYIYSLPNFNIDWFLAKTRDNATPFILAASNGSINIVKFLIKLKEIDVQEENSSGYNSLHLASLNGKNKIVEILVEYINVNKQNKILFYI
ncbi:hypothetical protein TRFO_11210 [Tritrichomonas foetus]|uniref:DUF3447 domain-containing protein n=1 Tax=Tritrichomonas foetus TaxID=1144522 RepID=A0A1J4JAR1_9EUKA|nr:hypothetical protein TRFO_11210 [Tritrichomonas foetus]|eukprot:OHS94348.1 hypothetical protein TRFO_11210 [Tritrichomonas foetus]